MNFSKSVILNPIGNKKHNFKNKEEQDKQALENFNKLDKKVDLFCDDQVRLKYCVNKIIQDMQDFLAKVNLSQQKPPFIHNTFGLWRKNSYEKLEILIRFCSFKQKQVWRSLFIEKIDEQLFQQFISKLWEPYQNHILYENYQIPQQLEPDLLKKTLSLYQEMQELSQVICEWCVQIEITFDIIERVNLYEICNTKQSFYISDQVKREFDINKIQLEAINKKDFNFKDFLMKKALVFGVRKLSGMFKSKGLTWGTILSVMYSVAAGSTNPVVAILIGGMGNSVVSNALSAISEYLEKDDKRKLIHNLIVELTPICKNLKKQNEICEQHIKKCLAIQVEQSFVLAQEELKISIEKLMETDIDEYTYSSGGLLKENQVGEWNIVDYADDLEEEINGDYALIDLPNQKEKR